MARFALSLTAGLLTISMGHAQQERAPAAPDAVVTSQTLAAFARYDARAAARVQLKLSWTGTEFLPAPGLAIHSNRRIFDPEAFVAGQRLDAARGHYNGDRLHLFYDVSLAPEVLRQVLVAVATEPGAARAACRTRARRVSLAIVDPHAVHGRRVELLLTAGEERRLLATLRRSLRAQPAAAQVIGDYAVGRW